MRIVEATPRMMEEHLPAILRIYARAHGLTPSMVERRREIMLRHFYRRGFGGFLALDGETLSGFAYGYTGEPGQYWYELVHAVMEPEMRREWLEREHFEFVELAVDEGYRRMGLGGKLHDALLDSRKEPVALLTVRMDNVPALNLYFGKGWKVLVKNFRFSTGGPPFYVMGKVLGAGHA